MAEVATSGTIEFMTELLRRNDYVTIPSQLGGNAQDALNLLEFIIYVSTWKPRSQQLLSRPYHSS